MMVILISNVVLYQVIGHLHIIEWCNFEWFYFVLPYCNVNFHWTNPSVASITTAPCAPRDDSDCLQLKWLMTVWSACLLLKLIGRGLPLGESMVDQFSARSRHLSTPPWLRFRYQRTGTHSIILTPLWPPQSNPSLYVYNKKTSNFYPKCRVDQEIDAERSVSIDCIYFWINLFVQLQQDYVKLLLPLRSLINQPYLLK